MERPIKASRFKRTTKDLSIRLATDTEISVKTNGSDRFSYRLTVLDCYLQGGIKQRKVYYLCSRVKINATGLLPCYGEIEWDVGYLGEDYSQGEWGLICSHVMFFLIFFFVYSVIFLLSKIFSFQIFLLLLSSTSIFSHIFLHTLLLFSYVHTYTYKNITTYALCNMYHVINILSIYV